MKLTDAPARLSRLYLVFLMLSLLLGSLPAHAQLVFTFSSPTLSGVPGDTLTYAGTLLNSGTTTLFLNSDSLDLIGIGLTPDDSGFLLNVPSTLNAGATTEVVNLFTVVIDTTAALGDYPGGFTILGGANSSSFGTLAAADFTVRIANPAPANVPEPGSLALMMGVFLIGAAGRGSRRTRS